MTTVTRMAALRRQKLEKTVTRITTLRGAIPVTVGTFERFGPGDHTMGGGQDPQDWEHTCMIC